MDGKPKRLTSNITVDGNTLIVRAETGGTLSAEPQKVNDINGYWLWAKTEAPLI